MWGGVTTPNELRAIADVVDKFNIPTVKVTGGQRIDLLGVKKEDLPAVWADLNDAGMVSGHAYAKALRTVKTCVGTDWCRFGTQDSTGLGIKHREVHVGLVDAGQGQDGGLRLSAQLRRGDLQGRRRDLRRFRLRDPLRRRRRPATSRAPSSSAKVATEDEALEVIVALIAALSRAGLLSRAHLQMGEARRPRRDPRARCVDDRAQAQGAASTASSTRSNSRRSIPGRSAPPASDDARVPAAGRRSAAQAAE